jgi:DNA-binding Lrp family transcriptional regulator
MGTKAMGTKQGDMDKEKLVKIVQELLKTGDELDFLMELRREDLEKLCASIRDGIYRSGEK